MEDGEKDYLFKTDIDYTICDKNKDKPLMCIEFDGRSGGYNREGEYIQIKNDPDRKRKLELKLRIANENDFPFFIISFPETEKTDLSEKLHLTVIDGIIGQTLAQIYFPSQVIEDLNDVINYWENLKDSEFDDGYKNYLEELIWRATEMINELKNPERLDEGSRNYILQFLRTVNKMEGVKNPEIEYGKKSYSDELLKHAIDMHAKKFRPQYLSKKYGLPEIVDLLDDAVEKLESTWDPIVKKVEEIEDILSNKGLKLPPVTVRDFYYPLQGNKSELKSGKWECVETFYETPKGIAKKQACVRAFESKFFSPHTIAFNISQLLALYEAASINGIDVTSSICVKTRSISSVFKNLICRIRLFFNFLKSI